MEMIDVSRLDLSAAGFRCHHKTVGRFASARFRRRGSQDPARRSVEKGAPFLVGVRREALGVREGGRPAIQVRPFLLRLWRSELVVGWRPFFVRWEVRDD
jgi:hypothetical protein